MHGLTGEVAVDLKTVFALHLPAGDAMRDRVAADMDFLSGLYASTRQEELSVVNWSPAQKAAFLHDQFSKQHRHYLDHYPRARWLVILRQGQPIGRIYVEQTAVEIRLMDVSLLPQIRNRGLGSALMRALLAYADRAGLPVSLHVEPFNPAMRLYKRLGFMDVETRGYYQYMERRCESAAS